MSKQTNVNNQSKKGPSPKAISKRLTLLFVLMLVASTLLAEGIIVTFGYGMIKDLIDKSLNNQVVAEAGDVNKELNSIFYYLNGIADGVENETFEDDEIYFQNHLKPYYKTYQQYNYFVGYLYSCSYYYFFY